jgi:hypothetical protein
MLVHSSNRSGRPTGEISNLRSNAMRAFQVVPLFRAILLSYHGWTLRKIEDSDYVSSLLKDHSKTPAPSRLVM